MREGFGGSVDEGSGGGKLVLWIADNLCFEEKD
jgi:hypothetical protein